ncbi:MAG TPA: aminotransferase class V-fold PLP-dependent enzyme [Vicinamibacterales bacterium]|nr:aminotransferase class V-fold PLP-dependent enzyme [Vicinamibacterales bacterium]
MLPQTDRLLLGPGPSPVSPRVTAALGSPARSHLDPEMIALLDDVRARLARVFRAPEGALTLAVSGTGTSAMEAAIANLAEPGKRALAIVTGYFGDRLAQMLTRYGATVEALAVDWGKAVDPAAVDRALSRGSFDLVTIVHGETSTGVRNPVEAVASIARRHDALVIADMVTSLGAVPVDMAAWDVDVSYSCSQKGLGAPSGLSPLAFGPRALGRRVACRSFYLDLSLLSAFWVDRKYHHTISAPLVYALATALEDVEEEGLETRWARHERVHKRLVAGLAHRRLALLPDESDRLWNLNAVGVPDGVNEAGVRTALLNRHQIEIGAGLGPLAGRIWRVGLMGSGATDTNVDRLLDAFDDVTAKGR